METFIPISAVKTTEERMTLDGRTSTERESEIKRLGELGRRILAQFPDNPDRDVTICYFHHKTKKNEGFIVLFDYKQWPRATLRHRGYSNSIATRGNVIRKANEIERVQLLQSYRAQALKYKTFDALIEDEKRCGASEEFLETLRRNFNPTRDEITVDHKAKAEKMIEMDAEYDRILQQLVDEPQKGVWA